MKKETTITLNKREVEIVKNALDNFKTVVQIKAASENIQRRELAINELYNIESIEKKLKAEER